MGVIINPSNKNKKSFFPWYWNRVNTQPETAIFTVILLILFPGLFWHSNLIYDEFAHSESAMWIVGIATHILYPLFLLLTYIFVYKKLK